MALGEAGAALVVEEVSELATQLPGLLEAMEKDELRERVSLVSAELVDARGLQRVCEELEGLQ